MKQTSPHNQTIIAFVPSAIAQPKACFAVSSSEFLSAISHELKTPLSAIIGFSDVLRDEITNPNSLEECLDYVAEINRAAVEMNEIIHDLLDVGQVASGNFSVDLSQEVNVGDVVKRAVRLNYSYALRNNISLKIEGVKDLQPVHLDEKRIKQILANLVSNAVKYSSEGGEVRVVCKQEEDFLEISVIDQGLGMTPSQVEMAFQKYQTLKNSNSGKVDSFGLGLPITKHLVEMLNGTIEVFSEVNKGTEMRLRFPLDVKRSTTSNS